MKHFLRIKKAASVLLTALLLICMLPTQAFAASNSFTVTSTNYASPNTSSIFDITLTDSDSNPLSSTTPYTIYDLYGTPVSTGFVTGLTITVTVPDQGRFEVLPPIGTLYSVVIHTSTAIESSDVRCLTGTSGAVEYKEDTDLSNKNKVIYEIYHDLPMIDINPSMPYESVPESTTESVTETVPESTLESIPETTPESATETVPESKLETTPETTLPSNSSPSDATTGSGSHSSSSGSHTGSSSTGHSSAGGPGVISSTAAVESTITAIPAENVPLGSTPLSVSIPKTGEESSLSILAMIGCLVSIIGYGVYIKKRRGVTK